MERIIDERYQLVRRIGKGGYGEVWLATDQQLSREVALKLVRETEKSRGEPEDGDTRLKREAVAMANVDHPNVVSIFDVGESDAREVYMVMERLSGHTLLEELAENGPLDPTRAFARVLEALDGLAAAHAIGIIHKDLKPANLFLHHVGEPREMLKLIDFGIARMDSLTKLTRTGRMVGSPRYLAPEYIMGEPVTPALDVYQMGLVLAEMLSGRSCVPPGLAAVEACRRHVESDLEIWEPLRESAIGVILQRALQRAPEDRYRTAAEFAADLREVDPSRLPVANSSGATGPERLDDEETWRDSPETITAVVESLRGDQHKREEAAQSEREVPTLPKEREDWVTPRLLVGVGVVGLALVILPNLIFDGVSLLIPPPPPPAEPLSLQSCLLRCNKTRVGDEEIGACQDLCRKGRPPADFVEAQR